MRSNPSLSTLHGQQEWTWQGGRKFWQVMDGAKSVWKSKKGILKILQPFWTFCRRRSYYFVQKNGNFPTIHTQETQKFWHQNLQMWRDWIWQFILYLMNGRTFHTDSSLWIIYWKRWHKSVHRKNTHQTLVCLGPWRWRSHDVTCDLRVVGIEKFLVKYHVCVSKGLPRQAEVAEGVPGRVRPRISWGFGTTRVVGRQPKAPARFTPWGIPGTQFQRLSRPQGTWFCLGTTEKSPVKPPGMDPGTFRLVAQCLNHYPTPGPIMCVVRWCFWHYQAKAQLYQFWRWDFLCKREVRNRYVSKINWKLLKIFKLASCLYALNILLHFLWNEISLIYSQPNADYFIILSSLVHKI